jgi:hypothetical protein
MITGETFTESAAHTEIHRRSSGQIIRLVSYLPELSSGEEFVAVDFNVLQANHPYARINSVATTFKSNEGTIDGLKVSDIYAIRPDFMSTEVIEQSDSLTIKSYDFRPQFIDMPMSVFDYRAGIDFVHEVGIVEAGSTFVGLNVDLQDLSSTRFTQLSPQQLGSQNTVRS